MHAHTHTRTRKHTHACTHTCVHARRRRPSSIQVISGRADGANGGEMIITAGDGLSQYKCNKFFSVRFISTEPISLLMRAWYNFFKRGPSQVNGFNGVWHETSGVIYRTRVLFVYLAALCRRKNPYIHTHRKWLFRQTNVSLVCKGRPLINSSNGFCQVCSEVIY